MPERIEEKPHCRASITARVSTARFQGSKATSLGNQPRITDSLLTAPRDLSRLFLFLFGEHCLTVAASEFLYSPSGVDKFLFTREKGVASRANSDFDIPASRSCVIRRATCTNDRSLGIVGMNVRLHVERTGK